MEIACSNAFSRHAAKPARDLVALKRNVTQRSGVRKLAFMAFTNSCGIVQRCFYFSLQHPARARISRLEANLGKLRRAVREKSGGGKLYALRSEQ